jgi:FlaA1/EpsC-like NDP-sugar epimerase
MSILSALWRHSVDATLPAAPRVLLIGTPSTIRAMRRSLRDTANPLQTVGCVLLSPQHHAGAIGLRVLGTVDELDLITRVHRIDTALLSLPLAMSKAIERTTARLNELGVAVRHLPTLEDQLAGRVGRPAGQINPDELLDRPPRKLDEQAIRTALTGRRVLITGAGGSIGSELAASSPATNPAALLLMERAENNLFNINRQIAATTPPSPARPCCTM